MEGVQQSTGWRIRRGGRQRPAHAKATEQRALRPPHPGSCDNCITTDSKLLPLDRTSRHPASPSVSVFIDGELHRVA